ncbi:MAG: helix-turn-helix domain-containing protein [Erysipelotrichaceae bacterium]
MEELGNILREARVQKQVSVEQASEATRLTVRYIRAIEKGDMAVFKDDLTYLRYFLKAYCDYLEVDYEEIKGMVQESIDEYTSTMSISSVQKYEDLPSKPQRANRKRTEYNYKRKKRKFDFSFASLLAVIIMILILLMFTFMVYVLPRLEKQGSTGTPEVPPVVEVPKDEEEEPPVIPEVSIEIVRVDDVNNLPTFEIRNADLTQELDIVISFGSKSWLEVRYNGVVAQTPKSIVYNINNQAQFKQLVEEGDLISVRLGYFANNSFKVNGTAVELGAELSSFTGAKTINFIVKGE